MKILFSFLTACVLLCCVLSGCSRISDLTEVFPTSPSALPPSNTSSDISDIEYFDLTIPNHALQYLYSRIIDTNNMPLDTPTEVSVTYIEPDDDVDEGKKILYSLIARGTTYVVLDIETKEHYMFYEQDDFEFKCIKGGKAYLVNKTGGRWFATQDFPHAKLYDPTTASAEKLFLPISDENAYYNLGFSSLVYGDISRMDISGNTATITFDVSQVKQNEPSWVYYPHIEYWYSVSERKATLNLYNITTTDLEKLKKIDALDGVWGAEVSITDVIIDEEKKASTQLTFYVKDGYGLYGEVPLYGEAYDAVEDIKFWTEPKPRN